MLKALAQTSEARSLNSQQASPANQSIVDGDHSLLFARDTSADTRVPHDEVRIHLVMVVNDELAIRSSDLLPVPQHAVVVPAEARALHLVAAWVGRRVRARDVVHPSEGDPAHDGGEVPLVVGFHVLVGLRRRLAQVHAGAEEACLACESHVEMILRNAVGGFGLGPVEHEELVRAPHQGRQLRLAEDLRPDCRRGDLAAPAGPILDRRCALESAALLLDGVHALHVQAPRIYVPHRLDFLQAVSPRHRAGAVPRHDARVGAVEELLEKPVHGVSLQVDLLEHLASSFVAKQIRDLPTRWQAFQLLQL
mmetsp:Transcript_12562/g.37321  ORF Transcript_12562/g.37321 Transcript_12562/m.37321 type:complete len:308 (-) Transcript_12562:661-1584(-)